MTDTRPIGGRSLPHGRVRLNGRPEAKSASPQIAARGEVVRIEPQADATCGVALRLERVRLL